MKILDRRHVENYTDDSEKSNEVPVADFQRYCRKVTPVFSEFTYQIRELGWVISKAPFSPNMWILFFLGNRCDAFCCLSFITHWWEVRVEDTKQGE